MIFILVGLPGSGKTHYISKFSKPEKCDIIIDDGNNEDLPSNIEANLYIASATLYKINEQKLVATIWLWNTETKSFIRIFGL